MSNITITNCCIVKQSEATAKKTIFGNCESVEQAISIIKNQTFKNSPVFEGEGISFTSHTSNNLYYIIAGHHKTI